MVSYFIAYPAAPHRDLSPGCGVLIPILLNICIYVNLDIIERFFIMAHGGKREGSGRTKGVPNKATAEAREAISAFVDNNSGKLQEWLDAVAQGVIDKDGEIVVPPNPEKAFTLFQSVIEYHVPKLSRTDVQNLDSNGEPADASITVKFK